jgi:hypothetical protein
LSAFLKILLSDPGNAPLQAEVRDVFTRYSKQLDPELQQRSAEYLVSVAADGCRHDFGGTHTIQLL